MMRKSREEKQVDGAEETTREEGGGGRWNSASVKEHIVLQLDKQALRGTNKIVTADPSLW